MKVEWDLLELALKSELLGGVVGVSGAIVYIARFYLVQSGRICGNSSLYALSKVLAACLVLFSLLTAFNLAALLIQVSYLVIGLYGVARRFAEGTDLAKAAPHDGRDAGKIVTRRTRRKSAVSVLC